MASRDGRLGLGPSALEESCETCRFRRGADYLAGYDWSGDWVGGPGGWHRDVTPSGFHACYLEPFSLDGDVPVEA